MVCLMTYFFFKETLSSNVKTHLLRRQLEMRRNNLGSHGETTLSSLGRRPEKPHPRARRRQQDERPFWGEGEAKMSLSLPCVGKRKRWVGKVGASWNETSLSNLLDLFKTSTDVSQPSNDHIGKGLVIQDYSDFKNHLHRGHRYSHQNKAT